MGQVKGCHLVGSVCMADAETVFRQCSAGMPHRLKRIPDGETGERLMFTLWQRNCFRDTPEVLVEYADNTDFQHHSFTPEQISAVVQKLQQSGIETGYDDAAIESYAVFKRLRDEGVIPSGTRFQVSIPAPANTLVLLQNDFVPAIAPLYEKALFKAMRNIQDKIPHQDLAFQIDMAVEMMFYEKVSIAKPWFHAGEGEEQQKKDYVTAYAVRMMSQVDPDVEVGLHKCYGDMGHRHWKEPESLAAVTESSLGIFQHTTRPINFFHMPVPVSAMDKLDAYYAPLTAILPKLREHGTDLYLGLVHYSDLEGTKKRIEAAKKAFGDFEFGVATECGWGRTPPGEIEDIMKIATEVSEPVV